MSAANLTFEVDPSVPSPTATGIDIESRSGASSWHRWSPRAGSTPSSSTRLLPPGPEVLPLGRLRPHLRAPALGLHVPAGPLVGLPAPQGGMGAHRHAARGAHQRRRADRRPPRRPALPAG